MHLFYKMATRERWAKFGVYEQLLGIIAELERARLCEEQNDHENRVASLARALELVDFSLDDPRWHGNTLMLFKLRDAIAERYAIEGKGPSMRALLEVL